MKRLFHVAAAVAFTVVLAAAHSVFAAEPATPALPAPENVTALAIGGAAAPAVLEKINGEWTLPRRAGAPINQAKVRRVLEALLAGTPPPVPAGVTPEAAGLAEGGGLRIALVTAAGDAGGAAEFFLGLRPEEDFDSAYVKLPDGAVVLVDADLRGELGLWENTPGGTPEPAVWFADSLGFDPAAVVGLTATYPDHVISLTRADGGGWTLASLAPGGELSRDGAARWVEDLSRFAFTDVAPMPPSDKDWTHSIVLALADGSELAVRATPAREGGDALAAFGAYPVAFVLPRWRFEMYFNRLDTLFPKAAPRFAPEDLLLIDVRRDGESVKIIQKDGNREALALPYAVRAEQAEQLARLLANWRPEDYADADPDARPVFGGTVTEVVLAGGGAHQYRLAGRHPVFPWRYVVLDGEQVFSVTGAEAAIMFPAFADILEIAPESAPAAAEAPAESAATAPEPEPVSAPAPVAEPEPVSEPEPEPAAPPAEAPAETPARKIVPAEVDFSGSVAEKAALPAP